MAVRYATKTGNWSDTTLWDNGALPVAGDDVYSNGFTVTIDQNVSGLSSIRNTASPVIVPGIATPVMTSTNAPSGIAFASVNNSFTLFDQNLGTTWQGSGTSGIVGYQFPSVKTIRRYAFRTQSSSIPTSWTFQGSNDGTTYTTLDTQTGVTALANTWYNYSIPNTTPYLYYRLNITAVNAANPWLSELQMTESTGTVFGGIAGGSFLLGGGVTADVGDVVCNTSPAVLTYSNAGTSTLITKSLCGLSTSGTGTLNLNTTGTVYANVSGGNFYQYAMNINSRVIANIYGNVGNGASSSSYAVIINNANAVINITGSMSGNIGANYTGGCIQISSGTLNIIGDIAGGSYYSTTSHGYGVYITGTSNLTVTGTLSTPSNANAIYVNGGSPTINISGSLTPTSVPVIALNSASTVTITAPLTAGSTQILNSSVGGTLNITGSITASSTSPAIVSSNGTATNIFTGPFISNNNVMPVVCAKMFVTNNPTYWRFQSDARTMYTADYNPDYPSTLNVRSGTTYGSGMTGTMIVPPASSVTSGVPVGNTVGTSANTVTAVQDAVWGKLTSTMTTSGSIGERVKNALTQDTLGNLLTNL